MFEFRRPCLHLLTRSMAVLLPILLLPTVIHAEQRLRLAAAADLQPVLPPILAEFEQKTGISVEASYQSSATLATQILNGAPFDLFMAADLSFPQRVIAAGLADQPQPVLYARGTLVLWARKDSPLQPLTLDALRSSRLISVAIANPEHAPYGRAAKAALTNLGLIQALQGKLVVAENIAQAAQYVDSGNAEVGLISLTSALTDRLTANGTYVVVPKDAYPAILQGAVVLKDSAQRLASHQLIEYLRSAAVQKELARRGLEPPQ